MTTTPPSHDPEPTEGSERSRLGNLLHPYQVLAYLCLAWVLWFFLTTSVPHPPMAPDSWYYFDLSTTVFRDPGRTHTIRAFMGPDPYTAAFPPLYPALIAVVDLLTGRDHASGVLANLVCMVATAVLLDVAFWRSYARRGVGPTAVVFLLGFFWFTQDAVGGGSLAMAATMAALLLALLARPGTPTTRRLLVLGAVAGLGALVRFDALAIALVLPVALVTVRLWRWRQVPAYLSGVAIGVSPWVLYSLVHFGTPFASDNAPMATAVKNLHGVHYYRTEDHQTVFDDPGGWWGRVSGNVEPFFSQLGHQLWGAITPTLLGAAILVGVTLVAWRHRRAGWRGADGVGAALGSVVTHHGVRLYGAWTLAVFVGLAGTNIAPGFAIPRYYTGIVFAVLLLGFAVLLAVPDWPSPAVAVAAGAVVYVAWFIPEAIQRGSDHTPAILVSDISRTDVKRYTRPVADCLSSQDRVMVIRQHAVLSTLGPYFSKTTVYEPLNYWALPVDVRRKILEEYRITALYLDPAWTWEQRRGPLKAHAEALGIPADELQEGCTPGLYRISF